MPVPQENSLFVEQASCLFIKALFCQLLLTIRFFHACFLKKIGKIVVKNTEIN
jgi:hypothetical protein